MIINTQHRRLKQEVQHLIEFNMLRTKVTKGKISIQGDHPVLKTVTLLLTFLLAKPQIHRTLGADATQVVQFPHASGLTLRFVLSKPTGVILPGLETFTQQET